MLLFSKLELPLLDQTTQAQRTETGKQLRLTQPAQTTMVFLFLRVSRSCGLLLHGVVCVRSSTQPEIEPPASASAGELLVLARRASAAGAALVQRLQFMHRSDYGLITYRWQ